MLPKVALVALLLAELPAAAKKPEAPPPLPPERRIGLEPADGAPLTVTKDQVEVTVQPVDFTNYTAKESLLFKADVRTATGSNAVTLVVCQPPFFEIQLRNTSDQTLGINGLEAGGTDAIIVALEDDKEEMLEAARKAKIKEVGQGLAPMLAADAADKASTIAEIGKGWNDLIDGVPVLTGRYNILPGRKKTFYACFLYVERAATPKDIVQWFEGKDQVTFGIYDIPVERDQAGATMRKTSFQFTFKVAEFEDHYGWTLAEDGQRWNRTTERTIRIR